MTKITQLKVFRSGVVLSYTDQPQRKRAGVYFVGTNGMIPARTTTYMEAACRLATSLTIHPFAFRTHTHALGRVVSGWKVTEDMEWSLIGKELLYIYLYLSISTSIYLYLIYLCRQGGPAEAADVLPGRGLGHDAHRRRHRGRALHHGQLQGQDYLGNKYFFFTSIFSVPPHIQCPTVRWGRLLRTRCATST